MPACFKLPVILTSILIGYYVWSRKKFNAANYRGKRILVTGASSGIGEQIAYQYAKFGSKLVITARRVELLQKVQKKCKELGAELAVVVPADMANCDDRAKLVSETLKVLGGLDVLILNHGLINFNVWSKNPDRSLLEYMMNVNFMSFVDVTSMLLDRLKENDGSIGVVSSIAGKFGHPMMPAYAASKHALQGFYSSLRQDFRAHKINVSITLAVFGTIASEKVMENLDEFKTPISIKPFIASTESSADVMVKAVDRKDYELYYPAIAKFLIILHKFLPNYFEDMTGNCI
ncbi:hypothetical protein CHUAL_006196 [Chamberlinius hualienensis]